ncbi:hypothetical protein [Victivallis vadensis]|uniref:hypothetical protein n=1 Tax=Victivallis vadensis TaxID=172901 RepID=UPI003AF585FF
MTEFPKGFGVSGDKANATGRTTNNSVQVADMTDQHGNIVQQVTYQPVTEISEDSFLAQADFKNEAEAAQTGQEVVTGHNLTESNTAFATVQRTVRKITTITTPTTTGGGA